MRSLLPCCTHSLRHGPTPGHWLLPWVTAALVILLGITAPAHASVGSIAVWGSSSVPPSPNSGFTRIAAGGVHSLGLRSDGSVVAWGDNYYGQANVPSPNSGFVIVSAGAYHSLGLRSDGSIAAWGLGEDGQCSVPSPNAGFTGIAGGESHSLGLKADGSILAWGNNDYGQCDLPSANSGFAAIAAGAYHSLGLKTDGSVAAWGHSVYGQCNVPTPNTGFVAIAAGIYHSLGLKSDGSIVMWGYDANGAWNVPAPNAGFAAIAAGAYHNLGLKSDGSVVAWGQNWSGECNVPYPNAGFLAVAAGYDHSLGLRGPVSMLLTFSPDGGWYLSPRNVVIACDTPDAVIHYTTNGTDPTEADPIVASGGSVLVDRPMTLKARAFRSGVAGPVKSANFQFQVATAWFEPYGGILNNAQAVMFRCSTEGAVIHYRTDDDWPTEEDPAVTPGDSITVDCSMRLTVRAFKEGYYPSNVASAEFTMVAATPTLNPNGGTFDADQSVQATCATTGAEIHYTLDGSDPDESSPLISSSGTVLVPVSPPTILRVRAIKDGYEPSAVAGAVFRAPVLYRVRPTGSDSADGLTWETAKRTVQAAIDAAVAGDEVWVQAGAYVQCIILKEGVKVYGGFAGTETQKAQRDWTSNETILDGGQLGSVVTAPSGITSVAAIDGFTIRNGKAHTGGGVSCNSSPTIANNTITGNTATYMGGGISLSNYSSAMLTNNRITDNTAKSLAGGLACVNYSTATITGNTIRGNRITDFDGCGGGLYCDRASPVISGNTIDSNDARYGGGIQLHYASPVLTDNVISNNTAEKGAGITCGSNSNATISGNSIFGNKAEWAGCGGGIYCHSSTPKIRHNNIWGNNGADGAGIYCVSASPEISGNTITSNSGSSGGGIGCSDSSPSISNNTITANGATDGGGISCVNYSSPTISNNIVAFNSSGIYVNTSTPTLKHNCFWNSDSRNYAGVSAGTGDIQADPKLVSVAYGQVHILPDSPCRDAGDDFVVLPEWLDMDGQSRIQGIHVDIGADENDGTCATFAQTIVRVSPSGNDHNDGSTWAKAKRTVGAALDSLEGGRGDVWVVAGTYPERIVVPSYVHLFGGFSGGETARDQRDVAGNVTTLNGGGDGTVVTFTNTGFRTSTVNGFTICHAAAVWGGGIVCHLSSPTIENNVVANNPGTGILCEYSSSPAIINNSIHGNAHSGVKCYWSSSALISHNSITSNDTPSDGSGGGISCHYSSAPTITYNVISDNRGQFNGGGIVCSGSPIIVGNIIANNTGLFFGYGGGICCGQGSAVITNNTIVGNSAGYFAYGGGIYVGDSDPIISNNVIAFNSSGIHNGKGIWWIGRPVLSNNCVYNPGGSDYYQCDPGTNDVQVDPLFVNRWTGDYHLQAGSPCIGAGWNDAPGITPLDIDGQARIMGGTIDIGADEYEGAPSPDVVSILGARTSDAGRLVKVEGAIVSAAWPNVFYVEADDRSCGIRVEMIAHGRAEGTRATIVGTVRTNADGECFIDATAANPAGTGSVRPIGIVERALGGITGEQIAGGSGLGNIGLLIRTWGIVTQAGSGYLYVDDGSGVIDGTTTGSEQNIGVRVICNPTGYSSGDRVEVTGISSCFDASPALARRILARSSADVRKLDSP